MASCDAGSCAYNPIDADMDGHPVRCMVSDGSVTFSTADDCDDDSAEVHPGAWDGPATTTEADRCNDGIDQNCSSGDGDDKLPDGTSCSCEIDTQRLCDQESGGKDIVWPAGMPTGECKRGSQYCIVDDNTGKAAWGPCIGAVAPKAESCNGKDDSCDGNVDEGVKSTYYRDQDGDGAGTSADTAVGCAPPTEDYVPADGDCNDNDATFKPGGMDSCEVAGDDNCSGAADEDCECQTGLSRDCDPAGKDGIGICHKGTQKCIGGVWESECAGDQGPLTRSCTSPLDNDCNGQGDSTESPCKACTLGASMSCGAHPGYDGNGTCEAGSQSCELSGNGSSVAWSSCSGSVGPTSEACGPSNPDTNCSGINGDGDGCKGVYHVLSYSNSFGTTGTQLLSSGGTSEAYYTQHWQTVPVLTSGGTHRIERWVSLPWGSRITYVSTVNEAAGARCDPAWCQYEGVMGYVVEVAGLCPVGWQSLVLWRGPWQCDDTGCTENVIHLLKDDDFTSVVCGAGGLEDCSATPYCVPGW